ncbi:hypothetical protein FRACYDRAFT_235262 [Fragilariopsis cylindrus CCMP1102]|uniref:EamA domain-containing protein n=1 Tax=Fragilariopsis cylindrus CCMP1102 TaxID=635003 RepID=A0A1E7FU05_9STRA|nr:hypothetical protein FRACYDRAFT_235262 [Fragilariopsis cylindrus CCMP1102]|eukprot:OEU21636.1 hypothetical protein FRACYDRAFT_235262 [Fragilariopsis cylindrus CCMP1102]
MNDRTKGLLIILTGVLIISPDAVLVRFLSEGGAEPWTIIFWKMLISIPISASFAVWEAGGFHNLWKSVYEGRFYYALAIPIQSTVDVLFTFAFIFTTAANALLLINLNPLWCAIAGKFILGEILPPRTYVALGLALCCILIIFVPEVIDRNRDMNEDDEVIEDGKDGDGDEIAGTTTEYMLGDPSMKGNIISLFTGLGLALYITIVRHGGTKSKSKNINLVGAATLSGICTSIIALIVQGPGNVLPSSFWILTGRPHWQYWLAQIGEGMMIGVIFIVMTVAPRYITGAEVGLCVLLEAVLGPLFVYLAYGDAPSKFTIIGGSLLLAVLAIHESRPIFEKAKDVSQSISRRISSSRMMRNSNININGGKMISADIAVVPEEESYIENNNYDDDDDENQKQIEIIKSINNEEKEGTVLSNKDDANHDNEC